MHANIQLLIVGGAAGSLAALLAAGLLIQFRSSGVLNLGHGAVATLGAFVFIRASDGWGWPLGPAMAIGIITSAAAAGLFQWAVMRPMRRMTTLSKVVATIGLMLLITALIPIVFSRRQQPRINLISGKPLELPFGSPPFTIGRDRLLFLLVTCLLTLVLWIIYKYSRFGRATRAAADNERMAELLGYSAQRTEFANWVLGGALAGVAGVLLSTLTPPTAISLTEALISAVAIALLTRFQSFSLMLLAGIAIGGLQAILLRYSGDLESATHLSGWGQALPLLIIIGAVLFRSRATVSKSRRVERPLPDAPAATRPIAVGLVCLGLGVLWFLLVPDNMVDPMTGSLITMIVAFSIVVVMGYTGQVSLAQLTFAGFGAFAAAKTATAWSVPFPLPVLFGGLVAVPIALLIGAPAVRVRGINLAVVTLSAAIVADVMFFANGPITGADAGMAMPPSSFFGIEIDGLRHERTLGVVVLVFVVLCGIAVAYLRRSSFGLKMLAVRANERGAAATGVSVARVKLIAFMVAGALAGIAGSLQAYRSVRIGWSVFGYFNSLLLVAFAYLGGTTYIIGAVVTGLIANGGIISSWLTFQGNAANIMNLIAGVGVIGAVMLHPSGIGHDFEKLGMAVAKLGQKLVRGKEAAAPAATADLTVAATPVSLSSGGDPLPVAVTNGDRRPAVALEPGGVLTMNAAGGDGSNLLEVNQLSVQFGGVHALRQVDLVVRKHTLHGLIGPNGAGKTTLIDAITGFEPSTTGTVEFTGRYLDGWRPHERARAGLSRTFQNLELYAELTVAENIDAAAAASRRGSGASVKEIVALLGLEDAMPRRARELPHGRQRIVSIARALAVEPDLIVLDEPAAGLDSDETVELGQTLRAIRDRGVTILLIDHDMSLVMEICDWITVLESGRNLAAGTPAEILRNDEVRRVYLGDV